MQLFALLLATIALALGGAGIAGAQSGPIPKFVGAVYQDGCPFCCEFSCQMQPTPTPEFDPQGRQIFRRGSGNFLFIAEAANGTSGRTAGSEGTYDGNSVVPISNSTGRPSIQMQVSQNLGNGSTAIDCRTFPLGGVKAMPTLDFAAGQTVTTGLQDVACRFEVTTSSANACTRDRFGNFAFLSSGTTRQFCFQVPDVAVFPIGDTTVAVQFLDVLGNVGPRKEIVIRVDPEAVEPPTATNTSTRTITATRTRTATVTVTGSAVSTATKTPPPPPSSTSTATRTAVNTATRTATPTSTPTAPNTVTRTRTSSATPTPTTTGTKTRTPVPTPTATPQPPSIAGQLRYYTDDRSVPGGTVALMMTSSSQTATSNSTGAYGFVNLPTSNGTLVPSKLGDLGNPSAITALDASWVLQMVAGKRSFSAAQRLACDVTGNGSCSALDATRILQKQVGLLPRFVAATQCNSDWIFQPAAGPANNQRLIQPLLATGFCQQGGIALEPMSGDSVQQDFTSILFGDCTGNWQPPPAGPAVLAVEYGPHTLRARGSRPAAGGALRLPLAVKGDEPYYSLDLTFTYDSTLLTPAGVHKLRAAGDAMIVSNLTRPGVIRIAVASALPMPSGVSVISVDFRGTAAGDAVSVTKAMIDDLPARVE